MKVESPPQYIPTQTGTIDFRAGACGSCRAKGTRRTFGLTGAIRPGSE